MQRSNMPLDVAGLCAFVFGWLLWMFWEPSILWSISVLGFGIVGFIVGWRIERFFVSRYRRYHATPARQAMDHLLMGIGLGCGFGLIGALLIKGLA